MDDIIIPRMGKSLLEEFAILFNKFPNAAGFNYNRYNTEIIASNLINSFLKNFEKNKKKVSKLP